MRGARSGIGIRFDLVFQQLPGIDGFNPVATGLAHIRESLPRIGMAAELLVQRDLRGHGPILHRPDQIQHMPADVKQHQRSQSQKDFGRMHRHAKRAEKVDKRKSLAPTDATDRQRFIRHCKLLLGSTAITVRAGRSL